jgi:hypothetical protein
MKDKNLPLDNDTKSLDELTAQANELILLLENEKSQNNSFENYQQLLKINNTIEKKFHKNLKFIREETKKKIKKIIKKDEKKT